MLKAETVVGVVVVVAMCKKIARELSQKIASFRIRRS